MFKGLTINDRQLVPGDVVFCQEEFEDEFPDFYLMVEGEVQRVLVPNEDELEEIKSNDSIYSTRIIPDKDLRLTFTRYEVRVVRIVCSYIKWALLRPAKVKPGQIYIIPRDSLRVFIGRKLPSKINTWSGIIQVTPTFFRKERGYYELGNQYASLTKFKPNYELRGVPSELEEENGILKGWLTMRGLGPGTSVCLKFPKDHVRAIFLGDDHHIIWLNPLYYEVPDDEAAWPKTDPPNWAFGSLERKRIFTKESQVK